MTTTASPVQLSARNATPQQLIELLNTQQAAKLDVVVPSNKMRSAHGLLVVSGAESALDADGVTMIDGTYAPTSVFDDGVSDKLAIPRAYLRRLRDERPDLFDANVNGLLRGGESWDAVRCDYDAYPGDQRRFLLRLFRGGVGVTGVARAMLGASYALTMDNLDVLTAVMKGIQNTGITAVSRANDLSERHMRVRIEFPDINMQAPGLLENYRSPFEGGRVRRAGLQSLREQYGEHHIFENKDAPTVFLGLDLDSSETGGGAYNLNPVIMVVRCTNGWVQEQTGIRKIHRGAVLAEGVVKPSLETIKLAGQLITSETTDQVSQWLTRDYLAGLVTKAEEKAGVPVASPTETVPAVVAGLGFSQEEQKDVLDLFILGGQMTAGGVAQAVSAYAQTIEDVDRAFEVERKAMPALTAAAAL